MAAIDAFRFILKKDPHDFLALRGLLLAATQLNSMEDLVNEEKEFSYDPELIDEAVEGASEEDKEYFTEFDRIYSDKKELKDLNDEIEALRVKKRKIGDYITLNGEKREEQVARDRANASQYRIKDTKKSNQIRRHTYDEQDRDYLEMDEAVDFMMPDSLKYYYEEERPSKRNYQNNPTW